MSSDAPLGERTYDAIGVGLGPFNLGLAALLDPVEDVDAVFLESRPEFSWHPGLMLPGVEIQVPFMADLVTLADPTSPHSFLNYLAVHGRLYRFYFHERFHVLRREYEAYCRWVAGRLPNVRFGHRVESVRRSGDGWVVMTGAPGGGGLELRARSVVLGVGAVPAAPACTSPHEGPDAFHSAAYATHRERAHAARSITVVGSGQSAAEVFLDLLQHAQPRGARLDWFTRSSGFLPMEYSKLGLEHFSPEYTAYFHGLAPHTRDTLRADQDLLYKGISEETSARIYDHLYEASVGGAEPDVQYRARCELRRVDRTPEGRLQLGLHHLDQRADFGHETDVVVLATGYRPAPLPVADVADVLAHDHRGRPLVGPDYRVALRDGSPSTLFVQNAELHTHGVGTPDLGLGAHRNAVIVNALTGAETYPVRARNVFQRFGAPDADAAPAAAEPPPVVDRELA